MAPGATRRIRFATDGAYVVQGAARGAQGWQLRHNAQLWGEYWQADTTRQPWNDAVIKVKAHTTKEESEALGQGHFYRGNTWVDLPAQEAVGKFNGSDISKQWTPIGRPFRNSLLASPTRLRA